MASVVKADIRKQVKQYIDNADDITVKMVYAMLKVQKTQVDADEKYASNEIERRIDAYERGTIAPLTLSNQQLVESVRASYKKRITKDNG
jgi:hypothetical protein